LIIVLRVIELITAIGWQSNSSLRLKFSNNFCWHSRYDSIGWDVFGYYGPGCYNGAFADSHTWKYDGVRAYPSTIFNNNFRSFASYKLSDRREVWVRTSN